VDGSIEVLGACEGFMGEMMPLEIAPNLFDIVELGGIFRQPFDREPVGSCFERRARCLAGVDRAVIEDEDDRLARNIAPWAQAPINLLKKRDEVSAALGSTGVDEEIATRPIEDAEHRYLRGLTRRGNAQISALLRPSMRQIGMRERLGFVLEQQHDIARLGLGFEKLSAQTAAVDGVSVLTAVQRVPGAAPTKAPFLRSTTDSREGEMRTPERFSISSTKRGKVQFRRSATGADRTSCATARAQVALTGAGPGAVRVLSVSTPPFMKSLRHSRTVSSRTPNASAIRPLVQPDNVSRIARARSASLRSRDWPRSTNARSCSALAKTIDLPPMTRIPNQIEIQNHHIRPLDRLNTAA
jgi:hypothetical protein